MVTGRDGTGQGNSNIVNGTGQTGRNGIHVQLPPAHAKLKIRLRFKTIFWVPEIVNSSPSIHEVNCRLAHQTRDQKKNSLRFCQPVKNSGSEMGLKLWPHTNFYMKVGNNSTCYPRFSLTGRS